MSGLRAFIGSRDAAMRPPGPLEQTQPQPGHTNDRVKAKMQEMGFANIQEKSVINTLRDPQHVSHSRRQALGDQGRVSVPTLRPQMPGSSATNTRWHGFKSLTSLSQSAHDSVEDADGHRDIFDTDLEGLESTVTGSDLEDNQAFRGSMSDTGATNALNKFHNQDPSRGRRSLSATENVQHRHKDNDFSDPQVNDDIATDEDDYTYDGSDVDTNDDAPEQRDATIEYSPRLAEKISSVQGAPDRTESHQRKNTAIESRRSPSRQRGEVQRMKVPTRERSEPRVQAPSRERSEPRAKKAEASAPAKPAAAAFTPAFSIPSALDEATGLMLPNDESLQSRTRKRDLELDYDLTQLREMTYESLRQEAFDQSPRAMTKPEAQSSADTGLPGKLQHVYNLKGDATEVLSQRRAVFSHMTIDQYEECGDLMMEKFNDIMSRIKTTRQQKRAAAIEFEEEVAKREERVRAKKNAVDQDLARLKKAGEDVVQGKT